ncbi:hypothetical protein vBSlqSZDD2_63 [Serratia phage vB_SlqS_ZDD2]|nr:hypothetical protein vBSlqSZDD2_63 [Serratia phage vB_SlqS_ZDD2]
MSDKFQVFIDTDESRRVYMEDKEHISASALTRIRHTCAAKWKFEERSAVKSTKPLAARACLLDQDHFERDYFRLPDPADFENALVTAKDMQAYLKDKGIKGGSGKTVSELVEMCRAANPHVHIMSEIMDRAIQFNAGRIPVTASDYDEVLQMRHAIFQNEEISELLYGGHPEVSLFGELLGVKVKIRYGVLTTGGDIVDYGTAASVNPEEFPMVAYKMGKLMKMALQHDAFQSAYGEKPRSVNVLAQEGKAPFIPHLFEMDEDALRIGRIQYSSALATYRHCLETDSWPAYGSRSKFNLPEWLVKKYEGPKL